MSKIRINAGCGFIYLDGYVRVDIDPDVCPDVCCDIQDIDNNFKPESAIEVRLSHVLEHISPGPECFEALRAIWQILDWGGYINIVVPDVEFAKEYGDWNIFEKTVLGGDPTATEYMLHKNVFSISKLKRFLRITGYSDIKNYSVPGSYDIKMKGFKRNGKTYEYTQK